MATTASGSRRRRCERPARRPMWMHVPWSDGRELVEEIHHGLPVLRWGHAPTDRLATRRQLRAKNLRPGGQEPVALLRFRFRNRLTGAVEKRVYAELFLVELAKPVRPMTEAKWLAIDSALAARRTCQLCRVEQPRCVPTSTRLCPACDEATGASEAIATERRWAA